MKTFLLFILCLTLSAFDNLNYGIPGRTEYVIDHVGFAVGYNSSDKQPRWTIYCMTREEAIASEIQRCTHFFLDPEIPTPRPSSYRGSGYDLGHQVPAEDMAFSIIAMRDSFRMSNICPQLPAMNRGIWKRLESWIRAVAIRHGEVLVVTGPVLHNAKIRFSKCAIHVPNYFFKVVYVPEPRKMIAFLVPNVVSKEHIFKFAVTVDAVEAITDLDFFSMLPKQLQQELESKINVDDWK